VQGVGLQVQFWGLGLRVVGCMVGFRVSDLVVISRLLGVHQLPRGQGFDPSKGSSSTPSTPSAPPTSALQPLLSVSNTEHGVSNTELSVSNTNHSVFYTEYGVSDTNFGSRAWRLRRLAATPLTSNSSRSDVTSLFSPIPRGSQRGPLRLRLPHLQVPFDPAPCTLACERCTPRPETRNPKLENPKPETRNPELETRNPKPRSRNPEHESLSLSCVRLERCGSRTATGCPVTLLFLLCAVRETPHLNLKTCDPNVCSSGVA
jgi:hypothetical protein